MAATRVQQHVLQNNVNRCQAALVQDDAGAQQEVRVAAVRQALVEEGVTANDISKLIASVPTTADLEEAARKRKAEEAASEKAAKLAKKEMESRIKSLEKQIDGDEQCGGGGGRSCKGAGGRAYDARHEEV